MKLMYVNMFITFRIGKFDLNCIKIKGGRAVFSFYSLREKRLAEGLLN